MTVLERKVVERWQGWKESFRRWHCWKGKCSKDESVGKDSVQNMTVFERGQCWKGKCTKDYSVGKGKRSKDDIAGKETVRKTSVLERIVFKRWQYLKGKCSEMTMFERNCWEGIVWRTLRNMPSSNERDVYSLKESVRKVTMLERKVFERWQCWKVEMFERWQLLERNCMENYMKYPFFE